MTIIDRIQYLLDQRGLKIIDLAAHLNVTQGTVSSWKSRQTDPPTKYLSDIANFLSVSVQYLITGDEPDVNSAPSEISPDLLTTHILSALAKQQNIVANLSLELAQLSIRKNISIQSYLHHQDTSELLHKIAAILNTTPTSLLNGSNSILQTAILKAGRIDEAYATQLFERLDPEAQAIVLAEMRVLIRKNKKLSNSQ